MDNLYILSIYDGEGVSIQNSSQAHLTRVFYPDKSNAKNIQINSGFIKS